MVFSELPPSFVITATGSHFVSSSVVVFNGAPLATTVISTLIENRSCSASASQ
jgi:hypothetical protein